jgi:hypothetical protein
MYTMYTAPSDWDYYGYDERDEEPEVVDEIPISSCSCLQTGISLFDATDCEDHNPLSLSNVARRAVTDGERFAAMTPEEAA